MPCSYCGRLISSRCIDRHISVVHKGESLKVCFQVTSNCNLIATLPFQVCDPFCRQCPSSLTNVKLDGHGDGTATLHVSKPFKLIQ